MKKLNICVVLNLDEGLNRYSRMYYGIQKYAEGNCNWKITWSPFPEQALKNCQLGDPLPYDGIIGRINSDIHKEATRLNIPMINLWLNSEVKNVPTVHVNYHKAGQLAAEHLLSRGFKKFINVKLIGEKASSLFSEGMQDALQNSPHTFEELPFDHLAAYEPERWEEQSKKIKEAIKNWEYPVGLCCGTENLSVLNFILENNIRIPEQLAFILTTEESSCWESINPSITSVHCNYIDVGRRAAILLHDLLQEKTVAKNFYQIEPSEVIARDSTDTYVTQDEIVKESLRYITDNIQKNIRMDDIIEHVNVSYSALQKRFKEALGHSIKHEIDRLRVIQAKRLLADKKLKINSIHHRTGFSTALNLRRVFVKATGMTPSEYRQTLEL